MAIEYVEVTDANGAKKKIACDQNTDGSYTQANKVAYGDDGVDPTLVSDTNGLPVRVMSSALPTGAATAALQTTGNTSLSTLAAAVTANKVQVDVATMPSTAVTGPLTNTELRASAVPVTATNATAANFKAQVEGTGATGATKTGNPVRTGAVFNTTQPTVTNGQTVDAQATARGGLIVATGVDPFTVSLAASQTLATVTTLGTITNVVHVDDNGGSLTVDGSVSITGSVAVTGPLTDTQLRASAVPVSLSAGTSYVGKVRLTDGTNDITLLNLTNSKPIPTAIVDGNGNQITSFGGGTQYADGAAAAGNPTGTAPILVARSSPASVATAGNNVAQRGSIYGAAYIHVLDSSGNIVSTFSGGGGGGTTLFDVNASFTRPADTTAYTVGDAITDSTSAPTTLSVSSVGSGNSTAIEIDSVIVTSSVKGTALPYLRVFISNGTLTATNDNAAFALSDSENDGVIAQIDMGPPYSATNNARLERHDLSIVCTTSSTNTLNVLLVADSAYTPASGEIFKVIIRGKRLA